MDSEKKRPQFFRIRLIEICQEKEIFHISAGSTRTEYLLEKSGHQELMKRRYAHIRNKQSKKDTSIP
jgi:hypothetical protein